VAALSLLDCVEYEDAGKDLSDDGWVVPAVYLQGALPARVLNAACVTQQIEGAIKPGKRWLARRSAVDAWLRAVSRRDAGGADDVVGRWERSATAARRGR
jgi:hypothetical protein